MLLLRSGMSMLLRQRKRMGSGGYLDLYWLWSGERGRIEGGRVGRRWNGGWSRNGGNGLGVERTRTWTGTTCRSDGRKSLSSGG